MRRKSFEVEVNPEVIRWAIETSGWSIPELSKKLKVSEKTIESWLKGEKNPTIRQLENLAKYVKRPLSVFFLHSPPKEKPLPKDYRMLPNREGIFNRETILAIRVARKLQEIAKELLENLGISTEPNVKHVNLTDSPTKIAEEYRKIFQIDEKIQKKWRDAYEAFNFLRKYIENLNIFVFQLPMPVEDARGFTLADEEPFVIVINSKENIEPRLFTLLHEFAHILLRESGIDLPEESLTYLEKIKINKVERWCNEFASEFLIPRSIAIKIFEENKGNLLEEDTLKRLSRRYKVSKTMLLYKMVKLGYLHKDEYEERVKNLRVAEKEGFVSPDKRCLVEKGERFVSLVDANFERENITFDQALEYLGIKSKHYEKILSYIKG